MPRLPYLLGAALVGSLLAASPASAVALSPTPDPLPGSTFQGADGDQDDSPPYLDWQALQAGGRVRHSPDLNAADDAFQGGSKEDKPGQWELTTEKGGVDPAKDNILDAWSSVSQPGSRTFLYLAFTREKAEGTTFVTFELNRDDRLWDNGRARIPCRSTGDVLVSYEPQGNRVEVVLQRWVTTATDPATGCATSGKLDPFTSLTPNVDAQGALNASSITSRLPGYYENSVPPGRFGETALDLERVLAEAFGEQCLAFSSVWMHSRSSTSESSNMRDYVRPQGLDIRTCAASGTKFFDRNANGVRDSDDPGIARFLIWADYDDDGIHDTGEPFSVSDNRGRYVIYDIRPPDGTYTLREKLVARRSRAAPVGTDWVCSYPNEVTPGGTGSAPNGRFGCGWGPIDVDDTPYARRRNFGNWYPAELTVKKQLEPPSDPGRFNLLVNGEVVLPAAGDGERVTLSVPPGVYDVSEIAVAGTDPAAYRSSVDCRRSTYRRAGRRSGIEFEDLALFAGQRAVCTFRNVRLGSPAIAIRKVGPAGAAAGEILRYSLHVENIGDVPFSESNVNVTDQACDEPPELVAKEDGSGDDKTPGALDPGDIWTYRCSKQTSDPGDECDPTRVDNTGSVIGTVGDTSFEDDDSISTIIFCPDVPRPPPPVPVDPDSPAPGPVEPAGPQPPDAGSAGTVRVRFQRAVSGCIRRLPRVRFEGTRIRRIRVYVNGRLQRRVTVRLLQRRLRPFTTLAPGRYRITVRVEFQRGAGTNPITLTGILRVCAAAQPRYTG